MLRAMNDVQYLNEVGIEAYEEKIENGELLNVFDVILSKYPYVSQDIFNLVSESSESVINLIFLSMLDNAFSKNPAKVIDVSAILITLGEFTRIYCEGNKINQMSLVFEEFVNCTISYLIIWIEKCDGELSFENGRVTIKVDIINQHFKDGKLDYLFKK